MKTEICLIRCNPNDRKLAAKLLFESPLPQDYQIGFALYHAIPVRVKVADLLQAVDRLPARSYSLRKKLRMLAEALSELEK